MDRKASWIILWVVVLGACGEETEPEERSPTRRLQVDYSERRVDIQGELLPPYTLALTYDDGPDVFTFQESADQATEDSLAHLLYRYGIRATFFINGCRLAGHAPCPDNQIQLPEAVLTGLIRLGHRVAIHAEQHVTLTQYKAPTWQQDVQQQLGEVLEPLTRLVSDGFFLFRPPYGKWQVTSCEDLLSPPADCDPAMNPAHFQQILDESFRVSEAIAAQSTLDGLVGPVNWDISGNDYLCAYQGVDAAACAQLYLDRLTERPQKNGIILMHDRNEFARGTRYAIEVTKYFLEGLRAREDLKDLPFTFVPLDALPGVTGASSFGEPVYWKLDGQGGESTADGERPFALGDVNGDGQADVCTCRRRTIFCALSTGAIFGAWQRWSDREVDGLECPDSPNAESLLLADVSGDRRVDACFVSLRGLECAVSTGRRFSSSSLWTEEFFTNEVRESEGVSRETIRLGDVSGDGQADLCWQDPLGLLCALSSGGGFTAPARWLDAGFTEFNGLIAEEYGSTLQLGDLNGDGRADVCARGVSAVQCAFSSGEGFSRPSGWTLPDGEFSDRALWNTARSRYGSLRLGDIDGDGRADLCGRAPTGIVCATSVGIRLADYRHVENRAYLDSLDWDEDARGASVQLGDINGDGKADLCGRNEFGLLCICAP